MNRTLARAGSLVNFASVAGFALMMLFGLEMLCYFCSIFIALSLIVMVCAFAFSAQENRKTAGFAAVAFAAVYTAIIVLVYFAQLTTVRAGGLTQQAAALLDYQQFGLAFNYDLLGYAMMALSTFFAGLAMTAQTRADRWLKGLLLGHGVFFLPCLICPMLGLFSAGGSSWVGTALLEFWCAYFMPIGILSFRHFSRMD